MTESERKHQENQNRIGEVWQALVDAAYKWSSYIDELADSDKINSENIQDTAEFKAEIAELDSVFKTALQEED